MTKHQHVTRTEPRFDEREWRAIKSMVRDGRGLDADATTIAEHEIPIVTVGDYYRRLGCDVEPPPGFALPPESVMLRSALQRVLAIMIPKRPDALSAGQEALKTAREKGLVNAISRPGKHRSSASHLSNLRRQLEKIDELTQMFVEDVEENGGYVSERMFGWLNQIRSAVAYAIEMKGGPKPQRLNSSDSVRNHVTRDFLDIWLALGGKPAGADTERFLQACLAPVFDDKATIRSLGGGKISIKSKVTIKSVQHWLTRYRAGTIKCD